MTAPIHPGPLDWGLRQVSSIEGVLRDPRLDTRCGRLVFACLSDTAACVTFLPQISLDVRADINFEGMYLMRVIDEAFVEGHRWTVD